MAQLCNPSSTASTFPRWVLLGALLIPAIYLPTLGIDFDFNDDGCLIYPTAAASFGEQLQHVWDRTIDEFHHRGPFRPVCWAHWEAEANLLGDQLLPRRLLRWAWGVVACGLFLALLHDLAIPPPAALLTAALGFWNPYRNEIWLAFGLTEAFAMPYALLALLAARRAAAAQRAWPWDLLCLLCLLACLGIKNTFLALIPPLLVLRLMGGGLSLRAGWACHWPRVCLLAAVGLLPVAHYILFKLEASAGAYHTHLEWAQLPRMLRAVAGAANADYVHLGLLFSALAVWVSARSNTATPAPGASKDHRLALLAGLAMLLGGIAVYLPVGAVAGRYTMPAVWGIDLLLAVLFAALLAARASAWKRLAYISLAGCLLAAATANLGRQWKTAARNDNLWQALHYVEREAPRGAELVWVGTHNLPPRSNEVALAEGYHFHWHLTGRGRADLRLRLVDQTAERLGPIEPGQVVIAGIPPAEGAGPRAQGFHTSYWANIRSYQCYVWLDATARAAAE
jgi:hypothetical protein